MEYFRVIHPDDSVAVALTPVSKGTEVLINGIRYTAKDDIPFGHKMALRDFSAGEPVIKYGAPIGHTTQEAVCGSWLHSHNMATNLNGVIDYVYRPVIPRQPCARILPDHFQGYRRADGSVGTRNEVWVIPTVSCVNSMVRAIAAEASRRYGGQCDGIVAYPHNAGCSQLGDDFQTTQRLLASIVRHPNAGGVLLVSLGCENNNLKEFLPALGSYDSRRIRCMIAQEVEGDEVEYGVNLIGKILEQVCLDRREEIPACELKIGFKCGGSDAFSGITANPLCGSIAEKVTDLGGIAVLTEVPEMFGAETQLMNRADSPKTFAKVVEMINRFKRYYLDYNMPIYENPAPGNKDGGITTLEEKSLGCIQKGGRATVTDTLGYGERAHVPGLNLLTGPGNDSVSITNLLASGVQVLLFTTGRGNPLGTAVPTIKLASNGIMASRKSAWIDFNAGVLMEGTPFDRASEALWQLVIDVVSGKKTQSEIQDYREIMIFKNGVML